MKTLQRDELFEIFKKNLHEHDPDNCPLEDLINNTVSSYMNRLFGKGFIPNHFIETVQEDLSTEVRDMYRKLTYGHIDVKSYLLVQKSKTRNRAS